MAGGSSLCPACIREIRDRQAQHRHVSHAGVRRADHRDALAAAEGAAEHYREACERGAQVRHRGRKSARVAAMAESAGGAVTVPDGPIGGLPQVAWASLQGSRMEVAVAIGTDPATTFSAIVPAPPEVEEFLIAGFLRGKPVEIVKCETVDLEVPAHAEIVLEGYVELGELRTRRTLRRPHRLLHHAGRVPCVPPDLHHAS